MKYQCDLGLKGLKEGRISDMIFLANTMLDVGMPSAEFAREWVKKNGGEKLNRYADTINPTLTLLTALLLAPLAALHAAPLSVSLDAPSWKPIATAVPEARRPGAFDARKEEGLRLTFSD